MVNPGFAGQKMVDSTMRKAEKLHQFLKERKKSEMNVEVDGNITFEHAKKLRETGADIFVAGTSSIFTGNMPEMEQKIRMLREVIA